MEFNTHNNFSLITAILPRQSTHLVLDEVMAAGGANAFTQSARGSVIKDRWYQNLLPTLSPEQELVTILVPNDETDHLMEQIVMVGKLRMYGAGSIFATRCEQLVCRGDFPLWSHGSYRFESVNFDIRFKRDLVLLVQIVDKGEAEAIARAAIRAGAQGPTISYVRGFGLRDRLGLLRITKKHEKELISVVVDRCDLDAVFEAMAIAGRVDQPGRGFLYQVSLAKGLTNLSSVFHAKKHSASIQQIVRAIDELQGNAHWRANQLLIHDPRSAEFQQDRHGLIENMQNLGVFCHRKDSESLLDIVLGAGTPGASIGNWRLVEAHCAQTKGGRRIHREFAKITMVVRPHQAERLSHLIQQAIKEQSMKEACVFSYAVPRAKTFVSPVIERA